MSEGVSAQRRSRLLGSLVVLAAAGLLAACNVSIEVGGRDLGPGDIVRGETLYGANCARCHGDDLRGTDGGPSFLSPVYEPDHHGDGAFLLAVTRGVPAHHWDFGDMPAVDGLSSDDVAAITAYVRSVQDLEGFEDSP